MAATPRIARLDDHVIDQIAAGEVVERPASAAKELIENALDAGARTVQVDLVDGGLAALTVTDDGCGMTPADARMAFVRHATSKLRDADDLARVATLGFRGEALAALAAIAEVTLTTRPAAADAGFRLRLRAGKLVDEGPAGCPPGTSIAVRDLFCSTPARRKFMRSPATEQGHVVEAATRVALGARHGGIVVTAGTRRLLDVAEGAVGASRILMALGPRAGQLAALSAQVDDVAVSGFIGQLPPGRQTARPLWCFVNGRFVRDRMVQRAVTDAGGMGLGQACYLFVDLPVDAADINVHPQKLEVRFRAPAAVYAAVAAAVRAVRAASQATLPLPAVTPQRDPSRGWVAEAGTQAAAGGQAARRPPPLVGAGRSAGAAAPGFLRASDAATAPLAPGGPSREGAPPAAPCAASPAGAAAAMPVGPRSAAPAATASVAAVAAAAGALPLEAVPARRDQPVLVGQLDAEMFVCADGGALVLVHWPTWAAHQAEAQLTAEAIDGGIRRCPLVLPAPLVAESAWATWLAQHWATLADDGLEVEPVGPGRYVVRAVPEALATAAPDALARAAIAAAAGAVRARPAARRGAVRAAMAAAVGPAPSAELARTWLADLDLTGRPPPGVGRLDPAALRALVAATRHGP